jgi:hypothetical protein
MPLLGTRGAASLTGFGGLAKLGYLLRNSLRFRASNTAYLTRTGGTPSNGKTATYSFWMKRGILSSGTQWLFTGGTTVTLIGFNSGADTLSVFGSDSSAEGNITTAVFRDPAAWYHVVIRINTTEGTAADRIKIYVNGVQQAVSTNAGGLVLDSSWGFNTAGSLAIGRYNPTTSGYCDLYLAEVYFIDGGTPRDVSAFAKTDPVTGQWIPIKYTGTYGNNGFYLNFNDTSAVTAAALGKDSSGNGNNWTPTNISITAGATYDPVTDVPTLSPTASNYATFNPLMVGAGVTVSQGNLFTNHNNGTSGWVSTAVTQAMPATGKWYIEMTVQTYKNGYTGYGFYRDGATQLVGNGASTGANDPSWWSHYGHVNQFYNNSAASGSAATWSTGTMMLAFDADAGGKAYFGRNGTWYNSSDPAAGTNAPFTISRSLGQNVYFIAEGYNNIQWTVNAGQQGFAYTPPTGFKALNTYNLP